MLKDNEKEYLLTYISNCRKYMIFHANRETRSSFNLGWILCYEYYSCFDKLETGFSKNVLSKLNAQYMRYYSGVI